MAQRINVAQYHLRPLEELDITGHEDFPPGTVWRVRQPLEGDFYRLTEVERAHNKRVQEYSKEIAERAIAAAAKSEAEGDADPDAVGRKVLAEESDEDRVPLEVSQRYARAAHVAIFLEPEQTPEVILDVLGPDLVNYLFYRVMEVMGGDAAKKRVAATSPATT